MTLRFEDTIKAVHQALYSRQLKAAMKLLQPIYDGHPSLVGYEELERVGKDYVMMRDFMLRGYDDPQREQVYERMLHELYRLTANLTISWRCKNVEAYANAHQVDNHLNRSHDFIKTVLERYVSDEAILTLGDETERRKEALDIRSRHQTFMERLFCALFISLQWTEADQVFFERLLLSPLIDRNDALLIVSGLTLAVMNVYDERKWCALANVYRSATDVPLRQRALIGWALTSHPETDFFKKQQETFSQMMEDAGTRAELLELQKQVFFCLNAEKDNATIRKDIIPNMMKGSNLRLGKFGIEEKSEDELTNILHPNADEEAMEKVEKSMERMREMEKKGADVYFGGFSQMKRFPFFRTLSNWFAPFADTHPGLSEAQQKVGDAEMMKSMVSQGMMCDSDKYSLVLAMGQVIDRIPPQLRDAMRSMGSLGSLPHMGQEDSSPTYHRRMYLQNLYRFFRLWPQRAQVAGFFTSHDDDPAFFLCAPLYGCASCAEQKLQLGQFLLRHGMYDRLRRLLSTMDGTTEGERLDFLQGCLLLHDGAYLPALEKFSRLLANGRESMALLRATARAAMATNDYILAYDCFSKLQELDPTNLRTRLNACVAAQKSGNVKAALNTLYELYYNHPDDLSVQRVLAWTLLNSDNPEKAIPLYEKLLAGNADASDFINAGYARWMAGNLDGARKAFALYPDASHLMDEFLKDLDLLKRHGISATDLTLMADAVCDKP